MKPVPFEVQFPVFLTMLEWWNNQYPGKVTTMQGLIVAYKMAHKPKKSVGRNDPCPCGSGKKYKKCCGRLS